MQIIKVFLKGTVIGIANIIPGVSGGTMALVLGIYERLIAAIHNISLETVKSCFGVLKMKAAAREVFWREMRRIDVFFLGTLGLGAVVAIVALANAMTYLLEKQHDPTYGFFFGLVAVSAWVPYQLIRKKTWVSLLVGLVALGSVVMLANTMSGEAMLEKEQTKYEMKLAQEQAFDQAAATTKKHAPWHLLLMFIAGAVAISAMILPGISGSFLLLLMGAYFEILKAITYRDFLVLFVFALGCGIGILVFTRFLNFLLKRWHDVTMSFLLGLVLGSLWAIWPFKAVTQVGEKTIYLANQMPTTIGSNALLTTLTFLLGGAIVSVFIWLEQRRQV
ncbi:DUF368 domain-containing protein [bacterium]|nr:DUF368 domain-containing protein [bacterium]